MKAPNNEIPQEMNWADYCDALRSEYFVGSVKGRKPLQGLPQPAGVAEAEKSPPC